jgi:acetyl esterase/lipase
MQWVAAMFAFVPANGLPVDPPPVTHEVEIIRDIAYFDGDGADPVRHRLDLYLPKGVKDVPVLLFLHGGGWSRGDKSYWGMATSFCTLCAKHGIAAASANYRLSPSVKHPGHVEDAARAFAWLHENIAKYGGRPDRLFVSGHSAGGHLTALLATDPDYLKTHDLSPRHIKAAIPISGVFRLPENTRSFYHAFGTDGKLRQAAAPTCQVQRLSPEEANGNVPPFLILYADNDVSLCGKQLAQEFTDALIARKIPARCCEAKDRNHLTILLKASQDKDPVGKEILDFIRKHSTE